MRQRMLLPAVVLFLCAGCGTGAHDGSQGQDSDVGGAPDMVPPDLAVREATGDCLQLCLGKECGLAGQCDCGSCGLSNKYQCDEQTNTCECAPLCGMPPDFEGWECGQDGCGGSCGECGGDTFCDYAQDQSDADAGGEYNAVGGSCVTCAEMCAQLGLECGPWASAFVAVKCECGQCPGGTQCSQGKCGCQPQCAGKVCGADGCGGSCGTGCPEGTSCSSGKCVKCTEDAQCDDGLECTENLCSNGSCKYPAKVGPCDDGDPCTADDHCEDGVCIASSKNCSDGNDCTQDSCVQNVGCEHKPLSDVDCANGAGSCINGLCKEKKPTCPQNWKAGQFGGLFCYRPFNPDTDAPLKWLGAEGQCEMLGGNLVSIHTEEENDFVKGLIAEQNFANDTTWIGLNDIQEEGAFKWTDQTAVQYQDWSNGEPNNPRICWVSCRKPAVVSTNTWK